MVIDKEKILKDVEFKQILDELLEAWNEEQRRRHEFWAEADEGVKAEFILGEIIYHSPVYRRHGRCLNNVLAELLPFTMKNKLGEVGVEKMMIRLTRNDFEPDICFWRQEKTTDFEDKQSAFPAPDFVLEILSDSTKNRDYGIKKTDYALHGVEEYWIIDPVGETVEQYLLQGITYELSQKLREGTLKSVVIEGFAIDVRDIFARAE